MVIGKIWMNCFEKVIIISKKPNFKRSYFKANEILFKSKSLVTFPVDVFQLIDEYSELKHITYDELNFKSTNPVDLEIKASDIITKDEKYSIRQYEVQNRSTSIREFGHYVLGHDLDLNPEDELYGIQKIEASYFADQLLMPNQVIRELNSRKLNITEESLVELFGVSKGTALKRLKTISDDNSKSIIIKDTIFDDLILEKYETFINDVELHNQY